MNSQFNKYKIINIGNKKEAVEFLNQIKEKWVDSEYKVTNLGLTNLNKYCRTMIFHQEIAYINHSTLIDAMKSTGGRGRHNYHGLTPNEIVEALASLKAQRSVYSSKKNSDDVIIVSSIIAECGYPIIVIIELNASLKNTNITTINKIKSVYPKRNFVSFIESLNKK